MRVVIQRVKHASVTIEGVCKSAIQQGFLVLVGIEEADTEEDAKELIALAKPLCCHINLIPVNPIKERDFVQSDTGHIQAFKNKLESKKIHVTIRREMGRDIDGACGQLRRRHTQEMQNPDGLSQEEN